MVTEPCRLRLYTWSKNKMRFALHMYVYMSYLSTIWDFSACVSSGCLWTHGHALHHEPFVLCVLSCLVLPHLVCLSLSVCICLSLCLPCHINVEENPSQAV